MNHQTQRVCWAVRHGERLDEVELTDEQGRWFHENRNRYPLDAPLTERGQEMAALAAERFVEDIGEYNHGLDVIYSSPLHRCVLTAFEFAKRLYLPIIIVPGLAACTAACQRYGPIVTDENGTWTLKKLDNDFLTKEEIRELLEGVDVAFLEDEEVFSFFGAVTRLISTTSRCMIVTHREGIRYMDSRRGKRGYCHIMEFKGLEADTPEEYEATLDLPRFFGNQVLENPDFRVSERRVLFRGFDKQR